CPGGYLEPPVRADETERGCSLQPARQIPIAEANKEETPEAWESTRQDHFHQVAGRQQSHHHLPALREFGSRRIRPTSCPPFSAGYQNSWRESPREVCRRSMH